MPNTVLFSRNGVELSLSLEGENQLAILSFSENGRQFARTLTIEDIVILQEAIRRLLEYSRLLEQTNAVERGIGVFKDVPLLARQAFLEALVTASKGFSGTWRSTFLASASLPGDQDNNYNRVEADVFIGLPQEDIDIFTIERIQNATGDFMEAMGFELKTQDEPVFGSFFQKLKFLLKREVKQEAGEIYSKGKVALEAQFIDLPNAEATSKLATAAAGLIISLEGVSDAAIRCGSILLVKVTKDGVPKIITETVSPELAALLNKNPALLQNPSIVFDLISGMRAPDQTIEESGSTEIVE